MSADDPGRGSCSQFCPNRPQQVFARRRQVGFVGNWCRYREIDRQTKCLQDRGSSVVDDWLHVVKHWKDQEILWDVFQRIAEVVIGPNGPGPASVGEHPIDLGISL